MFKFTQPFAAVLLASALVITPLVQAQPAQAVTQAQETLPVEEVLPTVFSENGNLHKENTHEQLPSSTGVIVSGNLNSKVARTFEVQQYDVITGQWVMKSAGKTIMNTMISTRLPKVTGTESVEYRIYVPAVTGFSELTSLTQTVKPVNITAKLDWTKVYDNRLNLDSTMGFYGEVKLTFSQITRESVNGKVQLMNSKNNGATWETVDTATIFDARLAYQFNFSDIDHYLTNTRVLYKVVFTPAETVKDLLATPTESGLQSVNYSDMKDSVILNSTLTGKTLSKEAAKTFTVEGNISPVTVSRVVVLEEYNAKTKTWSKVISSRTSTSTGKFAFSVPMNPASQTLRVTVISDKGYKTVSTASTLVNRPLSNTLVTKIKQSDSFDKSVPWVNRTYTFSPKYVEGKITVTLQKYVNKKWVNVSAKTYNTKPDSFDVATPKGNANTKGGSTTYRVHVSGTKYNNSGASGNFTIVWENPNHYTGYRKTAYDYSKKYCPTVLISIDSKLVSKTKNVWGEAYMGQNKSVLYSKIPAKHLKTVSLHECAHHKQWQANSKDWKGFIAKANKIYGQKNNMGMEQNADCAANYWSKNSYYGYKGDCKGAKGTAGANTANGKKL